MDKAKTIEINRDNKSINIKYGVRHIQAMLLFTLIIISYALRVNLSVAIVAMVDNAANPNFEEYDWDSSTQSIIMSSFFWGYVVSQIPSGPLAQRFGAKIILLIGITVSLILNMLIPLAAKWGGWQLVCTLRVIFGIAQGFVYPSTHQLLSKWVPIAERGRISSFVYAGSQLGTVIMLAISGLLAASSMGWPSIFYGSSLVGIIWLVLWFIFGANTPAEYKNITKEEQTYIEENCGSDVNTAKTVSVPWTSILTSTAVWATVIGHCGHNFGFWMLLTNMPTYMKNVLDFNIKDNALLSALPYFVMWIMSFVFSFMSDFLNNRKLITPLFSRKLFNTIGQWIPMVLLIAVGYVTRDEKQIAVVLLTLAVGISAATYVGFMVNHMDLSPNYAGSLMGLTNFSANFISIFAPLVVGFVVTEETSAEQWRTVFYIAGGYYLLANTFFLVFSKAQIQPFNEKSS